MSDRVYLGRNVTRMDTSPQFDNYTKVIIIVGEDEDGDQLIYQAGDDTGATLEIENPWGTQEIANNILAQLQGYKYQPFTASGALLDMAAELGDGITVNGIYSVLAYQDISFGALSTSEISAPSNGEIDQEYPYESSAERKINRRINSVTASLRVSINSISAEVSDISGSVASIVVSLGAITQRVDDAETGLSQTLRIAADGVTITNAAGSTLTIDGGQLKADSVTGEQIAANVSLSAPFITGGTVQGGKLCVTGVGADNGPALYIYNGMTTDESGVSTLGPLVGYLSYDTHGSGEHEARNRVFMTTVDGTALKLQAAGNMSLEANELIYFHTNSIFADGLTVSGGTMRIDATANAAIAGEMTVTGAANFTGATTISGSFTTENAATFENGLTVSGGSIIVDSGNYGYGEPTGRPADGQLYFQIVE